MTLNELKQWKNYLGFSNKMLAERAGLPLGTVQKILSGETKAPRYNSIKALEKAIEEGVAERCALDDRLRFFDTMDTMYVHDSGALAAESPDTWEIPDVVEDAWAGKWRRQGTYTVRDYESVPDGVRVELINGVFYDMGAPSYTHQFIVSEVFAQIRAFMKKDPGKWGRCKALPAPYDVQILKDDSNMVQPDVLVFCGKDKSEYAKRLLGAPDFALEVVSPSNRRHDLVTKTNLYMNAGVKEYWIVDPDKEEVWVYDFAGEDFPVKYTFEDKVAVRMTGGELEIDFSAIKEEL